MAGTIAPTMLIYPHIDPVALQIGPLAIHWYGLTYLAAFGLFMFLGTLRLRHIGLWVLYPVLYFAYILLRGHLLGAYPYPFIDVEKLGYAQVFVNACGILAGFVLVALVVVGLDRWRGRTNLLL